MTHWSRYGRKPCMMQQRSSPITRSVRLSAWSGCRIGAETDGSSVGADQRRHDGRTVPSAKAKRESAGRPPGGWAVATGGDPEDAVVREMASVSLGTVKSISICRLISFHAGDSGPAFTDVAMAGDLGGDVVQAPEFLLPARSSAVPTAKRQLASGCPGFESGTAAPSRCRPPGNCQQDAKHRQQHDAPFGRLTGAAQAGVVRAGWRHSGIRTLERPPLAAGSTEGWKVHRVWGPSISRLLCLSSSSRRRLIWNSALRLLPRAPLAIWLDHLLYADGMMLYRSAHSTWLLRLPAASGLINQPVTALTLPPASPARPIGGTRPSASARRASSNRWSTGSRLDRMRGNHRRLHRRHGTSHAQ